MRNSQRGPHTISEKKESEATASLASPNINPHLVVALKNLPNEKVRQFTADSYFIRFGCKSLNIHHLRKPRKEWAMQ